MVVVARVAETTTAPRALAELSGFGGVVGVCATSRQPMVCYRTAAQAPRASDLWHWSRGVDIEAGRRSADPYGVEFDATPRSSTAASTGEAQPISHCQTARETRRARRAAVRWCRAEKIRGRAGRATRRSEPSGLQKRQRRQTARQDARAPRTRATLAAEHPSMHEQP